MGFQYSITAIGSVILQTAVNGLGSIAVASMTAASRISMFMVCPFDALGSTMATYSGQNVGAAKFERVKKGLISASVIGSVYSVLIFVALLFIANYLIYLFVSPSETEVVAQAHQFLLTNAFFYIPLVLVNTVRFTIQGMGFSRFCNVCRSSRNDCAFAHRTCICTDIRLFCRLLCKPTRMDSRRCLPGACIHPLPSQATKTVN